MLQAQMGVVAFLVGLLVVGCGGGTRETNLEQATSTYEVVLGDASATSTTEYAATTSPAETAISEVTPTMLSSDLVPTRFATVTGPSRPVATSQPPPRFPPLPTFPTHATPIPIEPEHSVPSTGYDDPEAGILAALDAFYGYRVDRNSTLARRLVERAMPIRNMYHLALADLGSFNTSYEYFDQWFPVYVTLLLESSAEAAEGRRLLQQQVQQQVYLGFYDPTSEIGSMMRQLEEVADQSESGMGPVVYWLYLVDPARDDMWTSPAAADDTLNTFIELFSS